MPARLFLFALLAAAPMAVTAQHGGGGATPPAMTAPTEAKQFDFLVGQWDLVVTPKATTLATRIHGAPRLLGTWKAWRAFDGFGIEDELRIVDGSGNPSALSHSLRTFSSAERRWVVSTLDVYRGRFSSATAEWRDAEMVLSGRGTDPEGKSVLTRTRFHSITPTAFRVQQDRSSDEGKTWSEAVLRIEAKRVAALAPR